MSSNETTFACSLANPLIRSALKNNVLDLKWDSALATKVVAFFTTENISGNGTVPAAILRSHFAMENLVETEIERVVARCDEYVKLGNNIDDFIKTFERFYKSKIISAIIKEAQQSPEDMAEEIERRITAIPKIKTNTIRVEKLGELDIDKVIREEQGDGSTLPSSFKLIEDIMPGRGHIRGSVICVCGSPGTGKSLFLMNEAVTLCKAGYKGLYVALGDLMRSDLISRFSSIIGERPLGETFVNLYENWTPEVKGILNNLKIVVESAGSIDVDSLADLIEARVQEEENIDFIMVDYDSNFQKLKDNMYEEGDIIYNKMSSLARPTDSKFRVVFIASQPKQMFWNKEIIPMEAAAESARKQAIIDVMITLGKSVGAHVKCGMINVPKNRRGKADVLSPYMILEHGRITEISEEKYTTLKVYSSADAKEKWSNDKSSYSHYK